MVTDNLYLQTRKCLKDSRSAEAVVADADNLVDFNTKQMLIVSDYSGKTSHDNFFRLNVDEMLLVRRRISARFDKKDLKNLYDRNVSPQVSKMTQIIDIENGKCLSFHRNRKGLLVMAEKPLNKYIAKEQKALFLDLAARMKKGEEPRLIPATEFKL
jgi:aromatic ring-cleaving dioxygenase